MSEIKEPQSLAEELLAYLNMRVDAFKLSMVENLAVLFSGGFGILVFLLFLSVAVLCFIAALAVWLAGVLGSAVAALLIVGGALTVISVAVFLLRDRLIADRMVRMLSKMFFEKHDDDDDAEN